MTAELRPERQTLSSLKSKSTPYIKKEVQRL